MRAELVEGGRGGGEILLGTFQQFARFVFERAAGIEFEVGLDIGDDGRRIVLAFVDSGEQDVNIGEGGIATEGVEGALERFGDLSESILNESQTISADGGTGVEEEAFTHQGLGLGKLRTLIENHGQAEKGRGEAVVREIDRLLEVERSGIELTEVVVGKRAIVVAAIRSRGQLDGGRQVGEAGFGFTPEEQARALFKGAGRFGGHGEFVNGDDRVARRRVAGGRRLRLSCER